MTPREIDHHTRAGYDPNKVAAEQVPLDSGALVTVLQPSKSTAKPPASRASDTSSNER
jgi:hypothetical protein